MSSQRVIGLIAGNGTLPLLTARGAQADGCRVCCVGLRGQADPALRAVCDQYATAGMARIGRWVRLLRRWGVEDAIMVGGVRKAAMHDPLRLLRHVPDIRGLRLWYRRLRHDRRNATVLAAVADELASAGVQLMDSTSYIEEHLATSGVIGAVAPSEAQESDIGFAWSLLQRTCDLHIGQSMTVREGDVVAVEAVEGTAAMIARTGELCRGRGWTLLKTAATDHDMRADVPSVGVDTVAQVAEHGGGCIALGSGRVILLDRSAVIAEADARGIAIVGVEA